jgi:hypothetical protein
MIPSPTDYQSMIPKDQFLDPGTLSPHPAWESENSSLSQSTVRLQKYQVLSVSSVLAYLPFLSFLLLIVIGF